MIDKHRAEAQDAVDSRGPFVVVQKPGPQANQCCHNDLRFDSDCMETKGQSHRGESGVRSQFFSFWIVASILLA